MPKRTLSRQSKFNRFLQTYLLACSNVPRFSTKKICDHVESEALLKKKYGHFLWRQKIEIFFMAHLFLIFVSKEIFLKNGIEMELKIFFIIFEVFFEWQKWSITLVTFKQVYCMQINHTYTIWTKEL